MARGRETGSETGRVSSQERFNSSRGPGKTDAGAQIKDSSYLKKGFGEQYGMQRNPKKNPAPKM